MTRYDGISEVLFDNSPHDLSVLFFFGSKEPQGDILFLQQRRRAVRLDTWDNDTEGNILSFHSLFFFS